MDYFIFDTETTGLNNRDEVIQFSALLVDETFETIKGFNSFYCMTSMPIHPEAYAVHKIKEEDLMELSGGKFFEEQFYDCMRGVPENVGFIHYSTGLDLRVVNQTLNNANLPSYDFGQKVACLSEAIGRHNYSPLGQIHKMTGVRTSLNNALTLIAGYNQQAFDTKFKNFVRLIQSSGKNLQIDLNSDSFKHNAFYDAFQLCYLMQHLQSNFR